MDSEPDTVSGETVGGLLERAARAVPAAVDEYRHGWWLRHTDSSMWWSGAALVHGASDAMTLGVGLDAAEDFYVSHDAPARFQICAGRPPGLDSTLSDRGYQMESPMSLQIAVADDIAHPLPTSRLQVQVTGHLDPAWFAAWREVSEAQAHRTSEWHLLQRVQRPSAYVTVIDHDRPIAVGRAVADSGWTGVFDMATAPHARRRGAAGVVISAIAGWAEDQRAPRIYIQAERNNTAARRLYGSARFTEIDRYHYRVQGFDLGAVSRGRVRR